MSLNLSMVTNMIESYYIKDNNLRYATRMSVMTDQSDIESGVSLLLLEKHLTDVYDVPVVTIRVLKLTCGSIKIVFDDNNYVTTNDLGLIQSAYEHFIDRIDYKSQVDQLTKSELVDIQQLTKETFESVECGDFIFFGEHPQTLVNKRLLQHALHDNFIAIGQHTYKGLALRFIEPDSKLPSVTFFSLQDLDSPDVKDAWIVKIK